jgi:hypothetical protein
LLAVARDPSFGPNDLKRPDWRDQLVDIAERECSSSHFPADVQPTRAEAEAVLGQSFANHPMVNVSGRAAGGPVEHGASTGSSEAFVLAEVVVLPDLAPTPPGGEYRTVGDDHIAGPLLVHGTQWREFDSPDDERTAAEIVLERVASEVPRELWRRDF